ncbi:DEAD/DEAH box helicase [Asaia astilbis]
MAICLRPYQERVSHEVGAILREGVRRVLVQMSTGAGKTVLASHFIERAQATGRRIFFLCHRIELVAGTSGTLERYGISHGVIAAGYAANPEALIQVCSIDTLKTRLGDVPTPWAIIVDETHHCRAAGWEQAISHFVDAGSILIGLTATPKRLDGRGLGAFFDSIVLGPQTADLITSGHLSGFRHFMPDAPDRFLVGDPVAHWQRRAVGLRSVGFAKDTAHSRRIVEQFNAAGVPAAHLDANTPKEERRNTIRAFADGHILVLINVDLFGEGFDLAAVAGRPVTVDCVMFYRRTKSLSLYLQWAGRALRPAPNKTAIVLDHAGNWYLHGDIDAVREWSLGDDTGKIAKPAERAPITCPECFGQARFPYPKTCETVYPDGERCGHSFEKQIREIEQKIAEGELREKTRQEREAQRADQKREEFEADSLADLTRLGRERGYKDPHKWAFMKWSNRRRKSRLAA